MSILELVVFLAGASLLYVVLKTTLIEKITENELVRTIIKIIAALIGIGIMIFSFVIN